MQPENSSDVAQPIIDLPGNVASAGASFFVDALPGGALVAVAVTAALISAAVVTMLGRA